MNTYRILASPLDFKPYDESNPSSGNLRFPYTIKEKEGVLEITMRRYPNEPFLYAGDHIISGNERMIIGKLYEVVTASYRNHKGIFDKKEDAVDAHATVILKPIISF